MDKIKDTERQTLLKAPWLEAVGNIVLIIGEASGVQVRVRRKMSCCFPHFFSELIAIQAC